uniref:Uncharacterized protein n=1 Tax=Arundo donax TaxID=35708 RepID=A0A0A8ZTM7_ARUDO
MPPTKEIPLFCFLCFFLPVLFFTFLSFLSPKSSSIILMVSASERLGRYSRFAIHSSALLSSHLSLRTWPLPSSSSPMAGAQTTATSFPLLRPEKTVRPLLNCILRLDTATSIWDCLCLSWTSSALVSARSDSSFFRQSSIMEEAAGGALSLTLDSLLALELLPPLAYRSPKTLTASRTDWNGREVSTLARLAAEAAVTSMTMSEADGNAGEAEMTDGSGVEHCDGKGWW